MRALLTRGDRRTLAAAAAALVLLVAGTLLLTPAGGVKVRRPTSYSADSEGAKAAYLLLQEAGYRVERWERSLAELPASARATLILAEPLEAPGGAEVVRLRQFVSEGGRVIATGLFAGSFLPNASIAPRPWITTWDRAQAAGFSAATRTAREISLVPQAAWTGTGSGEVTPLYVSDGRVVVVRYPYGRGEVLWWASATPLTNAGLREPGNLEFLLACAGEPGGRVVWDEYIHGYRQSAAPPVWRSPLAWMALQVTLLAIAVLVTYSRRSGPILPQPGEPRLSPLEFAQTLGSLYERANASSVALDIGAARFRYRLARRLGTPVSAPVDDIERALRSRWGFEDSELGATLRRVERARAHGVGAAEALRLVRALWQYANALQLVRQPEAPRR